MRRSSRSISTNIAEAWRKRRYEASFLSKLSDAEAEAAETQVWLEFSARCGYLSTKRGRKLLTSYDNILGKIVTMINSPQPWLLPGAKRR
ncbi:MAG TPA: four helix bundle protein [Thermodesulfobacteriota bacterium]|nr:four helix bundle protein [Thermodesulfobacteriota bacterium]